MWLAAGAGPGSPGSAGGVVCCSSHGEPRPRFSDPGAGRKWGRAPRLVWREEERGCGRGESPGGPGNGGMKPPPSRAEAFKYGPGPRTLGAVRGDLVERRQCGPGGGAVQAVGIGAEAAFGARKWVSTFPGMAPRPCRDAPRFRHVEGAGLGGARGARLLPALGPGLSVSRSPSPRLGSGRESPFWICYPRDGIVWAFYSRLESLPAASLPAFSHFLT